MSKIEKKKRPVPKRAHGYESEWKSSFQKMEIGDSLFYPFPDQDRVPAQPKAYMSRCRRVYAPHIKLRLEVVTDGTKGVRVWRVA